MKKIILLFFLFSFFFSQIAYVDINFLHENFPPIKKIQQKTAEIQKKYRVRYNVLQTELSKSLSKEKRNQLENTIQTFVQDTLMNVMKKEVNAYDLPLQNFVSKAIEEIAKQHEKLLVLDKKSLAIYFIHENLPFSQVISTYQKSLSQKSVDFTNPVLSWLKAHKEELSF
jgi:Skp family chaperone for outer membrane proteins